VFGRLLAAATLANTVLRTALQQKVQVLIWMKKAIFWQDQK